MNIHINACIYVIHSQIDLLKLALAEKEELLAYKIKERDDLTEQVTKFQNELVLAKVYL